MKHLFQAYSAIQQDNEGVWMRGLSFGELLDYSTEETSHWRDWFYKNPAVLDLACDIGGAKTVRGVVLHIVVVQMRYAERLRNLRVTEYAELASKTAPELFAAAKSSYTLCSMASATGPNWLRFCASRGTHKAGNTISSLRVRSNSEQVTMQDADSR